MRRSDVDGEGRETDANRLNPLSGSDRRLGAVIQFPNRRAEPPSGFAAEASPPEASAPFVALGPIVQAVVLRLKDDRVRLRVERVQTDREDSFGLDPD